MTAPWHLKLSVLLLAFVAVPPSPTTADQTIRLATANQILIAAGQRTLSQRMAREFCFADTGIARTASLSALNEARAYYQSAHLALAEGSPEFGVAALNDITALTHWTEVDVIWQRLDALLEELEGAETIGRRDFDQVVRLSARLFVANDLLAASIRDLEAMGNQALDAEGVRTIDHYARQSMLAEKLARETCLVARGDWGDGVRLELRDTLSRFEASLTASLSGMPHAGVPMPPTPQIVAQLAAAHEAWKQARATAHRAAAGDPLATAELEVFAAAVDMFMAEMSEAARLLAEHEVQSGT